MDSEEFLTVQETFREGFLCPFCIKDLGDITQLQTHVQKNHKEVMQPGDAIKGFLDKAKQKILKIENPLSHLDIGSSASNSVEDESNAAVSAKKPVVRRNEVTLHVSEPGTSRSHNEYFLKCRGHGIDGTAVRTNNLIMRLDKLINQAPHENRKAFEKETVAWLADKEAKTCQECNISFTALTRRRHHCRLCGKIMCNSCSQFLSCTDARKLTNPTYGTVEKHGLDFEETNSDDGLDANSEDTLPVTNKWKNVFGADKLSSVRERSEHLLSSTLSLIKRKKDGVSSTEIDKCSENGQLRICATCALLLDRWNKKLEPFTRPHPLVPLYDELCGLMREAHKLAPSYLLMAESLSDGETMYSLETAAQLSKKVYGLRQHIDVLSGKIEKLGVTENESTFSDREMVLQRQIRFLALQTMQEVACQLLPLPSEEEFKELQEKRHLERARQAELEREKNFANSSSCPALTSLSITEREKALDRHKKLPSFVTSGHNEGDQGWIPGSSKPVNPFNNDSSLINPLQEQLIIIKGYLNQAIRDGRLEEVRILEGNLRDLEEELRRQNISLPPDC